MANAAKEHLGAGGSARGNQREGTEGERDVGGHRDGPAASGNACSVHGQVQGRWHDHSADGGRDGQDGLSWRGQLAGQELSLDLQAHEEKKTAISPSLIHW